MKPCIAPYLALTLVAGFTAALAVGGEPKEKDARKEAIKKELEKLEGTWTVVSMEGKRTSSPAEDLKDLQLTIKGDRWTMSHACGVDKAMLEVDPAKEPSAIDLSYT